MRSGTIILLLLGLIGVGGVLYYYQAQIKALEDLSFQLISINVGSITEQSAQINIVLRLSSDSTVNAQVTGLSVDVYVAGQKVGNIADAQPFIIPAKGYSDAPLTLTVSPQLLIGNAVSLLTNFSTQGDLAITLVGYVAIKEGFVTLSVPFSYDTTFKQIT